MNTVCRHVLHAIIALAALDSRAAADADWPAKPITLVVPGSSGGVVDVRSRWLAPRLSKSLGQPVVVENRPGAAGAIATASVARAAPDGYTMLVTHPGTMAVLPHLVANVGYAPLKDFTHLANMGVGTLALVVNNEVPARNVPEFIAYLKAKDGAANYGSPGIGTPPHIATELFKHLTGTRAQHIPYKGGGASASDLMGGHIDFAMEGLSVMEPLIKHGRVRALAVTSPQRVATLPGVPTLAEAGVPGYSYRAWVGLAVPAGTPAPIAARLTHAIRAALDSDEGRAFLLKTGAEPSTETPEAFTAFVRAEYDKYGRLVRDQDIKAE